MRLQDHIDFTTLQWVKPELDNTLSVAREALESYVDSPDKHDFMRACAAHLHQVHGTLKMVELYGAAMVATEMEALAGALLDDQVAHREEAYAALMRGLMQLPDYLERISSGHRDVPVVLLPLLNDLRGTRDLDPLSESALFHPKLDALLPEQAPAAMSEASATVHRAELPGLRLRFQHQLLAWFRGQDAAQQLIGMRKTLLAITARCYHVHGRRLWWIAAGVLEGLGQGMLKGQAAEVRQLIGKVDRNLHRLIEHGEHSLRDSDADEVACRLLYLVAQAKQRSPQMEQLCITYALDSLLPDAGELEHARGSMSGHNRALLDSVSRALKDDLLRVKEALDLFLRQEDADPAQLSAQGEVLERVGDTLGMLALPMPRRVVGEQRRVLDEIANRLRPADEETLLEVAGSLLYVEASLDDHIESLGSEGEPDAGNDGMHGLPRSEALGVIAALMQETISNTGGVKDAIVAFVESGWEHERLTTAPALMEEVAGAMRMLSSPRPAELAQGVGRFIDYELLQDRRVPSGAQMDHLADALAALEYYLEAAREHRGGLEHILDVAEHGLAELGYWPLPATRAVPEVAPTETGAPTPVGANVGQDQHPELAETVSLLPGDDIHNLFIGVAQPPIEPADDFDGLRLVETESTRPAMPDEATAASVEDGWVDIEEEVVEQVPVADPLAANTSFNINAEGIDDDIREIFLEEVQEEIDNLATAQKGWLADPAQTPALVNIRRSFHTLKGSGRLVGAGVLGEFAWKLEDMLNRVLDHTIEPDQNVQDVLQHAIEALPQLLAALKGEGTPAAPLSAIMQTAGELAAGQPARVEDHALRGSETVTRKVIRRVPQIHADAEQLPSAALTDTGAEGVSAPEPIEADAVMAMPAMPSVDPVLLEILRSEVAQYLQTIRTAIQRSNGELPISEEMLRAVHTLHGAIAMVDIPLLTQLLSPLEVLFKRLRASGQSLSSPGVSLFGQAADVVDHVMSQFDAVAPQLPDVDALTAQIVEMRDHYPESQVAHVVYEPQGSDGGAEEFAADEDAGTAEPAADLVLHDGPLDAGSRIHLDQGDHVAIAAEIAAEMTAALHAFEPGDAAAAAAEPMAAQQEAVERAAAAKIAADNAAAEKAAADNAAAEKAAVEEAAATEAAAQEAATQEAAATEAAAQEAAAREAAAAREVADKLAAEQAAAAKHATAKAARERVEAEEAAARQAAAPRVFMLPDGGQIDADLLEVFIDEARELLDSAEGVLAKWHAAPDELSCVGELQRDLHTLKGGARIAGLVALGDLAHATETLLGKPIRDAGKTAALIGALEASFDQLNTLVQQVAQGEMPDYPQAMIDQLLEMAGAKALAGDAEPAANTTASAGEDAPQPVSLVADHPLDLPELLPEVMHENHSPQEQIRVRADLLDSLVSHAGEVAIYRSRLEQQVAGYRFNLDELETTVARLRSQLRMLEIETEAQIIARFQREHREAGLTVFDPLELDRYSQLQQYSRALAESVSDLVSIQSMLDELTRQAETLLIQQSRVSTELQEGLLRTRMLPFDTMVPNLRRTLRQAAQEDGKQAQLYVDGAHGEMDRNLLDRIKAPFEHMLRNAIAHGIESPAQRRKAGKPAEGSVHIKVAREATEVVIRVSDDGRGLNREAIRKRAIERGMLRAETKPTDNQLLSLIAQPGFSTASKVTQLAGRGVGMDVVANEIKLLGGSLSIESEQGQGTTFILRLPFTLAVTQAILVRIGEATFAIPMTSVQGVARVNPGELAGLLAMDEPSFRHGDEEYGVHDLAQLLGLPVGLPVEDVQQPLLLTRAGDLRAAIRIDAVLGSREIVVKSVGPQINSVPGLLGATIMGDGSVLIILDLAPLVRHGMIRREQRLAEGLTAVEAPVVEEVLVRPMVMVVDDSITMRKVTTRVLERHEYEVGTAKDGVDALEKLHERVPDLMLLDIEMPRMDGYELATLMKADVRFRDVPIIMITSRSGDKHRQRALDIGVDRYLGKPYQEAELLLQIAEVLEQRAMEQVHD
ncbi:MAG: Hpt domain-containing protein [Rhodanobacter sp.]